MPDREQTTREGVLAHTSSAGDGARTNPSAILSAPQDSQDEPPSLADDPTDTEPPAPLFQSEPDIHASPTPHELNQSLARLELNSLQVKHYLDAIEEKISRMEPRLEQLSDSQSPIPREEATAASNETPSSIAFPMESTTERRRRRFDIPPFNTFNDRLGAPLLEAGLPLDEEPWAFKPWLFARRRQLAFAGVVFLAFVTVLTFGAGNHTRPNATAPAPNTSPPAPGSALPKSSAGTPAPALPANPAPGTTPSTPDSASSTSETSAAPTLNTSVSSSTPNPDPQTFAWSPPSPAIITSKAPKPIESSIRPVAPASLAPTGRIRVSSGVMAGNLLYSPTPKYPGGLASLFHTEGKVTLQAVIARNGRVEDLRVLSGHHLLRGAAQDAVRTWRYRPFAIDGVPVEVATIITVEFHR